MTSIDIENLYDRDPRPFYRAALNSVEDAYVALDEHPLDDRPILVWNAAFKSIKHYFNYRGPGRRLREGFIAYFTEEATAFTIERGTNPLPVIDLYITTAFDPRVALKRLSQLPTEIFCEAGLLIPPVVSREYAWKQGEREALVMAMYLFDHTYRRKGMPRLDPR